LGGGRPAGTQPPAGGDDGPRLTRREAEIVELVAQGLSNKQGADRLVISTRTVESHVQNVLTKFSFTSRAQIATWYARRPDSGASPADPTGEPG
jgi:DNA-binding NarL/FixJ family response regulator